MVPGPTIPYHTIGKARQVYMHADSIHTHKRTTQNSHEEEEVTQQGEKRSGRGSRVTMLIARCSHEMKLNVIVCLLKDRLGTTVS
eukprot:COSAG06_NODE_28_length_32009_cov_31.553463_10_plen_85_part_00